jgi:O-antigen/teichoic acid export membrane protein
MFLLYIALARVLGPEQYGIFSAAVALGGILAHLIQFGFPTLLTREIAANPREGVKSTGIFLLLQFINFLLVLLILFPLARFLGFNSDDIIVCYLVIFSELFRAFKTILRSVLRGNYWFSVETATLGLERLFSFLIVGSILLLTKNLIWVVSTIVIVRFVDIIGLFFYLKNKINAQFILNINTIFNYLKIALPFAASTLLWVLYYQIDIVMIKMLVSADEAGLYGASYRLMEIFATLPKVFFSVAFIKVVKSYTSNPKSLSKEIYKSISLLLVFVLPLLIIAGFIQPFLLSIIYGKAFLSATTSLSILLPTISIVMLGEVSNQVLVATGREKQLMLILCSTVVFNLLSNMILIPYLGASGAAIATLLSELILSLLSLRVLMQRGFTAVGKRIYMILFISLLITGIPSLILNGMNLFLGLILMFPCIIYLSKFAHHHTLKTKEASL